MYSINEVKLVNALATNTKTLEYFCNLQDIDDMYFFAETLVESLSEKEYLDFIIKSVSKTHHKELLDFDEEIVSGGKQNLKLKTASAIIAALLPNSFSLALADNANTTSTNILKNTAQKNSTAKENIHILKKVGTAALASTALIYSIGKGYKHSDNFFQRTVIGNTKNLTIHLSPKNAENIEINGVLKGYKYTPNANHHTYYDSALVDKNVIFYSGSGSSNTYQIHEIAQYYTSRGATVYGIDYSGFGKSGKPVSGGKIRQSGIYSDAWQIYEYVLSENVNPENIIIHGFSLGGPVAAHVAARAAKNKQMLCRLVLQSSMKNTSNAAYNYLKSQKYGCVVSLIGSLGAYLFADQFDCEYELKKLLRYNPDIPIHICGGNEEDHLSLEKTKLCNIVDKFSTHTEYTGKFNHLSGPYAPVGNFENSK